MPALEDLTAALTANTAEIQRLTAITEKLLAVRTDAIETVKSAAAPVDKPATSKKTEKPAETAAASAEEKPQPASAPPKITIDELNAIISGEKKASDDDMRAMGAFYVTFGGTDTDPVPQDEAKRRMATVRTEILAHPKIKAETMATVPENMRKAAAKKIGDLIAAISAPAADPDEL
ncbi:hypothetical protein [Gemmobacter caeni]|nr:hypothetical protein [Gemmobacter caeni]